MITLPIAYDKITKKAGVVIPYNESNLILNTGVCRFFIEDENNRDSNWQTFYENEFVLCGELPITEKFIKQAMRELIQSEKKDTQLQEFYKDLSKKHELHLF